MPISDFFRKTDSPSAKKNRKTQDINSEEFVGALRRMDPDALEQLYRVAASQIIPYFRQRSKISEDDADEILCEALAICLNNIVERKYEFRGSPVSAYLFQIAKNQWMTFMKEQSALISFEESSKNDGDDEDQDEETVPNKTADRFEEDSPEGSGKTSFFKIGEINEPREASSQEDNSIWREENIKLKAVKQALSELSATCQELVNSYYYQNERLVDYSERHNQNPGTGRLLHHRCLVKFRELAHQYYQKYLSNENRIHR